jgi:hypothetical protein
MFSLKAVPVSAPVPALTRRSNRLPEPLAGSAQAFAKRALG